MKVDYLSCRIVRSGGTKIIAQHVRLLRERGHHVRLLTIDPEGDELWGVPVDRVKAFRQDLLGEADLLVGSWLRDVEIASRMEGPVVCHLCQGYEPIELSFRIHEEAIPSKYRYQGIGKNILFARKKWSFQKRTERIEKIYQLPTVKLVVSHALKEVIEGKYGGACFSIPNGVDQGLFRPPPAPRNFHTDLRILSVGPIDMVFKGIQDTFEAVRILKQRAVPIHFTRVSLSPPTEGEVKSGLVDRFLVGLNEREMAELYQESHILIAPSLWEGFGLPAVEAMSCGIPCILAESGSYPSLDPVMDFAYFVPVHAPEAIAEGILKIREDRAFRERMIERGTEVARRHSLEKMGEVLEGTFQKILKERRERS